MRQTPAVKSVKYVEIIGEYMVNKIVYTNERATEILVLKLLNVCRGISHHS
ncbi:MAG: hypothetical protein RJA11_1531 [Bacteroidota bacterium]|jgi:hypothetical protein